MAQNDLFLEQVAFLVNALPSATAGEVLEDVRSLVIAVQRCEEQLHANPKHR